MIKTFSSVVINKPIEEVFTYASKLENGLGFVPNLINISSEKEFAEIGQVFKWCLNMSGIESNGEGEIIEFEKSKKMKFKISGDANGFWTIVFSEIGNQTQIEAQIDYEVADSIMAKITKKAVMDKLGKKYNQMMLENLKILLED